MKTEPIITVFFFSSCCIEAVNFTIRYHALETRQDQVLEATGLLLSPLGRARLDIKLTAHVKSRWN